MGYYLYLNGYGASDDEASRRLAEAVGLRPADARVHLNSRFPRKLSAHAEPDDALSALVALKAAGFEGFIASKEELDRAPLLVDARAAELAPDRVSWKHDLRREDLAPELGEPEERRIVQRPGVVRAVFRGNVRWSTRTESSTTSTTRVGPLAVNLTRPGDVSLDGDREQVLLVKGAGTDAFVVVSERVFDFSCLGAERAYGPGANVARLQARLRAVFPEAWHDESLLGFAGDFEAASRGASTGARGLGFSESSLSEHRSTFESVVTMARLLCLQAALD